MSYLKVLPLADAKVYLRIDDTQNETDAEIASMIKSALSYIERHTHVMMYDRDKDFDVTNGCVRVYDYPINALVSPATATIEKKTLYSNYTVDSSLDTITLNVGYTDPVNVPSEIVELAKVIVDVMFYEKDNERSFKEALPMWANETLNSNKRYLI